MQSTRTRVAERATIRTASASSAIGHIRARPRHLPNHFGPTAQPIRPYNQYLEDQYLEENDLSLFNIAQILQMARSGV